MGRPTRSPGSNVFKTGDFEKFAAELAEEGNIRIVQVDPAPVEKR